MAPRSAFGLPPCYGVGAAYPPSNHHHCCYLPSHTTPVRYVIAVTRQTLRCSAYSSGELQQRGSRRPPLRYTLFEQVLASYVGWDTACGQAEADWCLVRYKCEKKGRSVGSIYWPAGGRARYEWRVVEYSGLRAESIYAEILCMCSGVSK
jgi:hypothetical protein